MIVAVGIFSIIMLTATGAFLTLINLDREARLTNDIVTNLSFAVDSMARSIRTGKSYDCNPSTGALDNCAGPTGGTSIKFTDADGRAVVYARSNGQITVASCTPAASCTLGSATPLTDSRVNVTALTFYVRGVSTSDNTEPQVIFTVAGTMTSAKGITSNFVIQGSATQRLLDLP